MSLVRSNAQSRVVLVFSSLAMLALATVPVRAQDTESKEKPPDPTRLSLDVLLDWENVNEPRVSPDGRQVVFTRQWTDKVEDRMRSELWIMDSDGSRQRFLQKGSGAQWSPDGTRLAFVADGEPKGAQLFVLWVATHEATQIAHLTESPGNLGWSPDGRTLAFTMQVPEKGGFPITMPKAPKGAKWADEPTVITRLAYRRDQQGYRPQGYRHIFTVDATGGTPRQLTDGDFDHGDPQWLPDGTGIVFDGLRSADADWQVEESEIYRIDVATRAVTQLTHRVGPDDSPRVSPDGRWIAYTSRDKDRDSYSISPLHVMDIDGSNVRALTPALDRQPDNLHWSADSSAVLFTVEDQGTIQVQRATLAGAVTAVTRGTMQFRLADVAKDGALYGVMTSAQQPSDIACWDGKGCSRLTNVNDDVLAGRKLGAVEELWWDAADGTRVQGWLVSPPDFDKSKKYPLILQIHGGPHAMFGVNFDFERQNHAACGYLLLYCNPRGSTGYGKSFGNAIKNAYPGKDYDDLMAGVDAAIARGSVDTDNLFVYGGSGGGVLTAWTVGMTDRFRAAVSMFPVIDWISFVGTTDGPYWYENFDKLPWEDVAEHWQRSPLRLVGNVKTPTMLITGELDLRTPIGQTEEYYQALKLRKVDTVMVRVPDEYHGASGRHVSNRLRRILYVRTWFEKHKKGAAVSAPAEASLSK